MYENTRMRLSSLIVPYDHSLMYLQYLYADLHWEE